MTFSRLFELYQDIDDTKVFRMTPFAVQLFNTACNTNFFSAYSLYFEVKRIIRKSYSNNDSLIVNVVLSDKFHVMFREDGPDVADCYKSFTLELVLAWLTQMAGIRRMARLDDALAATAHNCLVNVALFDPFAFRQLLKQDFDNPRDYYVCNFRYTDTVFDPRVNDMLILVLQATEKALISSYTGNPAQAWSVFWTYCQQRGIIQGMRLTNEDCTAITNFLVKNINPTHIGAGDTYDYRIGSILGLKNTPGYRLWSDFCATSAKYIVAPRSAGAFSIKC